MKRFGWPRPALLIGFVLAERVESSVYQTVALYGITFLERPIVIVLLVLTLLSIAAAVFYKQTHSGPMTEASPFTSQRTGPQWLFFGIVLLAAACILFDAQHYDQLTGLYPTVAAGTAIAFMIPLGIDMLRTRTPSPAFYDAERGLGDEAAARPSAEYFLGLLLAMLALLSFTVQQASGLAYWIRDPDHIEKSFDFGAKAARNGVFAARLAKAGMTAPDRPLTGDRGYLDAFAENPRPALLTDGLGETFEITRASIKKWSVGSPIQSVLDAIEALFGGAPADPSTVASIEVRLPSNRIHVIDDRDMPAVCCQHLVALALLDGWVTFAGSHDRARMQDPAILALREKITLVPDEALTVARPERQAIVTAEMTNGETRRHHAKVVRGTPDDPMPPDRSRPRRRTFSDRSSPSARAS